MSTAQQVKSNIGENLHLPITATPTKLPDSGVHAKLCNLALSPRYLPQAPVTCLPDPNETRIPDCLAQ